MEGHGHISTEHTIWCGAPDCGKWVQHPFETKKETAAEARLHGWKHTQKYGWVCASCSAAS